MDLLIPGLVSITLRKISAPEIVRLCGECGLQTVEWGGDVHVPVGKLDTARDVGQLTRESGLSVAAYGSYYRLGVSEGAGLKFADVAETAEVLGAPVIRVWAGNRASAQADSAYRDEVIADAIRINEIAQSRNLQVAFEYHGGTLTDTRASALDLLNATASFGLRALWQPSIGWSAEECGEALREISPFLHHVHVFQWGEGGSRQPLAEGETRWRDYLDFCQSLKRPIPLLLEFVEHDDPDNVRRDAATLLSWIHERSRTMAE